MANASRDRSVRVFQTGQTSEVARMAHGGDVLALAFSPDGKYLATASQDGAARLWLWRRDDLIAHGCDQISRNLTYQEWCQHMNEILYTKTCPGLPLHESFVEFGRQLAQSGKVDAAVNVFRQAVLLEPQLKLDPLPYARRLAAPSLIVKGEALVKG